MKSIGHYLVIILMAIVGIGAYRDAQDTLFTTVESNFVVDTLAKGLTVPWSIVHLPDQTILFSERNGKIRLLRKQQLVPKAALTVKQIDTTKKMGLLGICLHPEFVKNRYIYISYNYKQANEALLRVERYQFINDTLVNPLVILDGIYASMNHTGCRLKFGPDGKLYVTTGDADRPRLAQDLKSLNGKILRVNDDGGIPEDNPFVNNDTARKEVWTYGHRNTQGIDFQPGTGYLFNSEHGPSGGDEINLIQKGYNYGWPVIHHNDVREGMVTPLIEYTPSIAPSEALFYSANAIPALKGSLLVTCLRGEAIMRLQLQKDKVITQEYLFHHQYGRIRALSVGPDGYIYFSTSQNDPPEGQPRAGYDMILRIRPSVAKKSSAYSSSSKEVIKKKTPPKVSSTQKTPRVLYAQLCASCHGSRLEGTKIATSLVDHKWLYGSTRKDIMNNIRQGILTKGMPSWEGTLTAREIESLTGFILANSKKK